MAGEIQAIEKVVWTYLDGLYEGDTGKLAQAFHAVSHLYSADKEGVKGTECSRSADILFQIQRIGAGAMDAGRLPWPIRGPIC